MPDSSFSFTAEVRPVCELGLSAARSAEPDSWEDVSCYVHEVELFRGRERFNDRFEAATASISFDNRTGWGDLVGAPLVVAAQKLRPGRQMRVGVVGPWGTRWLFRGWIDRCEPKYDPVLHDIVVADCIDALGEAGSTIAPLGPVVGANETVDARLNRVLDSVGWFGTKRIIGASATTVISTQLGQRAIDMLSQAADSAGGVVHGDLAGNVVYKDLNWELFDPDTPPDGGIGNVDPGTPGIPGGPGYIDPTPGYVYNPDPPPITAAFTVKVCADGTEGTLVQQGNQFKIYAKDGRLLFESSGQTWDLGDFDGGCVAVSFDPTDDDPEPTRWDETEPDVYEIAPPPTLLPTGWGMEIDLLAFSQSGQGDGIKTSVVIGPVTPGPDCLLFMMFVCHTDDGVRLGPAPTGPTPGSITGGGFDWQLCHHSSPGIPISNHTTVVEVGRDDPGTFSVTLAYAPTDDTSKSHIAVLYRVRGAAPNMFERYVNDYRAWRTHDGNAGNGPYEVEVTDSFSMYRPLLHEPDAGLCLNLAASSTPPFGALFESSSGATWTIPPEASDLARVVSWNTGYRTDAMSPFFGWDDVNIGSESIGSGQCVMVVEPSYANVFHWLPIDWRLNAPAGLSIAGTVRLVLDFVIPEPESLIVVFVGMTADHDASDAITVTHSTLTFTRVHRQAMAAPSRGQGAIFTARVPVGGVAVDVPKPEVRWTGHTIESVSAVTFEVWAPNRTTPTGAIASTVLGTNADNSVNGPASVTLPAAPQADSAVLSFVYVTKDASTSAGVNSGGDDYVEEVEAAFTARGYYQAQSRAADVASALDPVVGWNDVQTGTAVTRSGIAMAIEIRPEPGFWLFGDDGSPLVIGGLTDAWQGTITSAEAVTGLDPNIGDLLWSLDPNEVILP